MHARSGRRGNNGKLPAVFPLFRGRVHHELVLKTSMRNCILIAGLVLLLGCPSLEGYDPAVESGDPTEETTWVARNFVGGAQCDPEDDYTPPDVGELLREAGVAVYRTQIVHHPVCAACIVCPSYAAAHFALIPVKKLPAAERLGFQETASPSVSDE